MSYGFRCAHCGLQETPHDVGLDYGGRCEMCGEKPGKCDCANKKALGYRFSLISCPGFKYSKRDEGAVVREHLSELIQSQRYAEPRQIPVIPDHLLIRAEKLEERYWRRKGYKDGLPPAKFNTEVWLLTSSGAVIDIGS